MKNKSSKRILLKVFSILVCAALSVCMLFGCAETQPGQTPTDIKNEATQPSAGGTTEPGTETPTESDTIQPTEKEDPATEPGTDIPTEGQTESSSERTDIVLSGSSVSVSGNGVSVSGSEVTITEAGTYVISGNLSDGRVIVDARKKDVTLILRNVNINCSFNSPLYIYKAASVTVIVEKGTSSTLSDGSSYTFTDPLSSAEDEEPNACLYSKADLTITGGGSLTVNGTYKNGITGKDTVTVSSCTVSVTAKNNGINGKDSLTVTDSAVKGTSGGDALRSTNDSDEALGFVYIENSDLDLTAGEDGIQAQTRLTVSGGNYRIVSGGGSRGKVSSDTSAKGLKGVGEVLVTGGTFVIDSCDDAIHSNGNVTISGGNLTLSTGDDGVHADEKVTVSGGEINITESYEGLEGATVDISGGTVRITASDDGINAAGGADQSGFGGWRPGDTFGSSSSYSINISGGVIYVNASGDGLDSNENLYISGGEIYVSGPTDNGNGALDYDGTATITGGVLVAAGSSGMAQNFGNGSTQGSILLSFSSWSTDPVTVKDSSGNTLISYTPDKRYNCVVVSCPGLVKGGSYTVSACGQTQTVTLANLIYGSGMGGGMQPGGGGFPGGGGGGRPGGRW